MSQHLANAEFGTRLRFLLGGDVYRSQWRRASMMMMMMMMMIRSIWCLVSGINCYSYLCKTKFIISITHNIDDNIHNFEIGVLFRLDYSEHCMSSLIYFHARKLTFSLSRCSFLSSIITVFTFVLSSCIPSPVPADNTSSVFAVILHFENHVDQSNFLFSVLFQCYFGSFFTSQFSKMILEVPA